MAKDKVIKKSAKKMTPYNLFMKTELGRVKETTPGITHKDAFKQAAQNWAKSAENPKNKKETAPVEKK
ncbi:uncharacterized protein EV154DRAFT_534834 [Mucor mucedo]|uniref:uncharacterized protein n=1 Tax=Mucor mucedo TaxID=29922 RepID=UPI00222082E2|nr:uncharacterized protein EV154DRAFT_534834 [Mucor mucedo]KAI7863250.1 hypothetical protein EV154DRAFT_534834 [Mucor mucedo]